MIITHKLTLSLDSRGQTQSIDAVQGDSVRAVEIALRQQGASWPVPEGTTAVIRYRRVKGGTGGIYDTMPDGTAAYVISEDKVTVYLVSQVFSVAGAVELQVTLMNDGAELTCFSIMAYVQGVLNEVVEDEEGYVNLTTRISDEVEKAVQDALGEGLPNALTINGHSYDGTEPVNVEVAKKKNGVIYVSGDTSSTNVDWIGASEDITEYYEGLMVAYRVPVQTYPNSNTKLNINGLGARPVYKQGKSAYDQNIYGSTVVMVVYMGTANEGYWQMLDFITYSSGANSAGVLNEENVKMYLVGSKVQYGNPITRTNKKCYIGTDNCLYSSDAKVMVESDVTALINAAMEGIATAEGVSF